MEWTRLRGVAVLVAAALAAAMAPPLLVATEASAAGYPRSDKIAMVPDAGGRFNSGGSLPTSGFPDGYLPHFADVSIESVRDDATDPLVEGGFDTVVLNSVCDIDAFLADARFKSRLESFVAAGGKLIIWDSECTNTDYSKFALPFQTSNPGAAGAQGELTDVEENTLSSRDSNSANYVNVGAVASETDAVGDANVFTTYDPHWFVDLRAKNVLGVDGPVQAYANLGLGLVIYSGLDKDFMPSGTFDPMAPDGATHLNRIWLLELLQPWNPDGLPNSTPVVEVGTPTKYNSAIPCQDVVFFGARGSGEQFDEATLDMGNVVYGAFKNYFARVAPTRRVVGTGVIYEAQAVETMVVGAYFKGIDRGVLDTLNEIQLRSQRCPTERYVLAGYSQGAMLVHRVMFSMKTQPKFKSALERVDAFLAIADGDRVTGDGGHTYGSALPLPGLGISWAAGVISGWVSHATFAQVPSTIKPRWYSVCDIGDAVCDPPKTGLLLPIFLVRGYLVHTENYKPGATSVSNAVRDISAASLTHPAQPRMTVTVDAATGGSVGHPYSAQLAATGAVAPYRFARVGASPLPNGLSLDSSGLISGVPNKAGTWTFSIRVYDANRQVVPAEVTIRILP